MQSLIAFEGGLRLVEDQCLLRGLEPLLGALDFLAEFNTGMVVLVGSSLGGAVALMVAAQFLKEMESRALPAESR